MAHLTRPSLLIIALLGLIISGYLLVTHTSTVQLVCGSGGCHEVQASIFSSHFGIPTAAYGVAYYALLGVLAALAKRPTKELILLLSILTASGFGISIYLTYLEAFVIHAWCAWCVASAILATAAFAIVWAGAKPQDTI